MNAFAMIRACLQSQENTGPSIEDMRLLDQHYGRSRPDESFEGRQAPIPMEDMGNPEAYRNLDEETTSWSG